jgi:hypothetical protein
MSLLRLGSHTLGHQLLGYPYCVSVSVCHFYHFYPLVKSPVRYLGVQGHALERPRLAIQSDDSNRPFQLVKSSGWTQRVPKNPFNNHTRTLLPSRRPSISSGQQQKNAER